MSDKESLIDGIINLLTGKKNEPISVEGYEFAGRVKLGRHPLVLNGAGVRTIGDKKIYALGLYLPEKRSAKILHAPCSAHEEPRLSF